MNMNCSRKYINSLISSIESIKDKYEKTIEHYDKLLSLLNQELITLPIGFRYTGTFYLKNSSTAPATFEKYAGVVYLREDLISWQIEEGLAHPNHGYHRNIFKEPRDGAELKREDAMPIYKSLK